MYINTENIFCDNKTILKAHFFLSVYYVQSIFYKKYCEKGEVRIKMYLKWIYTLVK